MDAFSQALSRRILILDGAMGTQLQRCGLSGDSEAFNVSHPDVIRSVHRAYIAAGADIIETNTFGANRIAQEGYGRADEAARFALDGARLARAAADEAPRKVWVAGSIGPTGRSLTLPHDLTRPDYRPCSFDRMAEAYAEQVRALVEGGVDLLLLETCFDALNAKAALYAISGIPEAAALPLLISVSVADRSGRTLTGQTLEAFYRSVQHARPVCFGLNCSLGAEEMAPLVADVASWSDCALCCYPNAGLPDETGAYTQTPEAMAAAMGQMARQGLLNVAGGCCGTTPDHIRAIARAVEVCAPRALPPEDGHLHLSGLEALTVDLRQSLFTPVGERTNVAGSRKFARLIAAGDYDGALAVAAGQLEAGAAVLDVSLDDAMLDGRAEMERFLRYVAGEPAVAKAPLMIDSSHWDTLLAGLKNAPGRSIVNSLSLKEGEAAFLEKARELRRLGAAVVVMAFDEEGQATTFGRKTAVCARAFRLLTEQAGYAPQDIILDANVLSVGTGIAEHARYGVDFIEAVRWIKANLGGAYTSGGISNLSFAFRGNNPVREAMHTVFLYHAIGAGLDMAIVNPGTLGVYETLDPVLREAAEDVILDRRPDATERLLEIAGSYAGTAEKAATPTAPEETLPVQERLARALVGGGSPTLRDDLLEALAEGENAVQLIEGPLMDGMGRVGSLFAEGKLFLPQVVKSARVMREAVAILQPYLDAEPRRGTARHRVLLATVQGDVHDIGKNICGIVLRCNGFEVTDLGVMVPNAVILEEAEACGAELIGVSGLITPSLHQMEALCREMASRGLETPLLVGGATTSALHTAVKLAPLYNHVFYAPDASALAVLATRLLQDPAGTQEREHTAQALLRARYSVKPTPAAPAAPAPAFAPESYLRGRFFEDIPTRELGIDELLPYLDWRLLYILWGIRDGRPGAEEEKVRLRSDAEVALIRMRSDCRIRLCARFGACTAEDDWVVSDDGWRLPMLRQSGPGGRSLADFVAPARYGFASPAGLFALSVHRGHPAGACDCAACGTQYEPLLERTLRLVLAEAASAWLDARLQAALPEGSPARIVKPAAGYASSPDHSLKRDILALLPGAEALDIRLTESCAMIPDASICGLIFVHPEASYPEIRHLDAASIDSYAARRGFTPEERHRFLGHLE